MRQKNRISDNKILILLCVVFICFFTLNKLYPLFADDYANSFILFTDEKIKSFGDIIRSQYIQYTTWGGRVISIGIGQFFLWKGKWLFNIFNSIIFIALIFLIFKNIFSEKRDKNKFLVFTLLIFLLWFGMPEFAETTIWLIGSVVYQWMMVIILIFLYIFKKFTYGNPENRKNYFILPLFLLGLLAGQTNENNIMALLAVLGLSILVEKKMNRYNFFMLLGLLLGGCFFILAPGNFVRVASLSYHPTLSEHIKSNLNVFEEIIKDQKIVWILVVLSLIFLKKNDGKMIKIIIKYRLELLLCIFSGLAMAGSPFSSPRAFFGSTVFLIIFASNVILDVAERLDIKKQRIATIVMLVSLCISYGFALKGYVKLNKQISIREKQIEVGKSPVMVFPKIEGSNSHMLVRDGSMKREDGWINTLIEQYYGLEDVAILDQYIYDNLYKSNNLEKKFQKIPANNYKIPDFLEIKNIYISEEQEKNDYYVILEIPVIYEDTFKNHEIKYKVETKYLSGRKEKEKSYDCDQLPFKHGENLYLICKMKMKSSILEETVFTFYKDESETGDTLKIGKLVLKSEN